MSGIGHCSAAELTPSDAPSSVRRFGGVLSHWSSITLVLAGCGSEPGNVFPSSGAGGGGTPPAGGASPSGSAGVTSGAGGNSGNAGAQASGGIGTGGASAGKGGVGSGGASGKSGGAALGGAMAGGGGSAGASLAGASGAAQKGVPIFVAQGHLGRTTISCDDGRTWVANRSDDATARCFENGVDCDHGPGSAKGLAYGNGVFLAAFGWGEDGRVERSVDGVSWEPVVTSTDFADVASGGGVFFTVDGNNSAPKTSSDGRTWSAAGKATLSAPTVRRVDFVPHDGGRFVLVADTPVNVRLSSDNGKTWWAPATIPPECGVRVTGAASGNGVIVLGGAFSACHSADGGMTWDIETLATEPLTSPPIWSGTEFMIWQRNRVHRSANGASWTTTNLVPSTVQVGPVTRSPEGTFVATHELLYEGSRAGYETQVFYRSEDGVNWQTATTGFVKSHWIIDLTFGYATPSTACPVQ